MSSVHISFLAATRPSMQVAMLGAVLVLAGCATNQLRLEYAGDVAARAKATTLAADFYLREVDATRTEANIELVAADPACGRQSPVLRAMPTPPTGASVLSAFPPGSLSAYATPQSRWRRWGRSLDRH